MPTVLFEPSDTKKFAPSAQRIISLGRILGWDIRWMGIKKDAVTMRSPNGEKSINIPTTNINANRAKAWARAVFRYSDDVSLARLVNGELNLRNEDSTVQSIIATYGTEIIEMLRDKVEQPEPVPERNGADMDAKVQAEDKTIVKVEPYMKLAMDPPRNDEHGNRRRVPSNIIDVITYSDGTTAFGCQDCDFITDKSAQAVTVHHHHHTGATRVPHNPVKRKALGLSVKGEEPEQVDHEPAPVTKTADVDAVMSRPFEDAVPPEMDAVMTMLREVIEAEFTRRFGTLSEENTRLRKERDEAVEQATRLRENLTALKGLLGDI